MIDLFIPDHMQNTMSVDLKTGILTNTHSKIIIRAEHGEVVMFIGVDRVAFKTPTAHKIGFSMVKKAAEALPGEFIVVKINGIELDLMPEHATQIGAALLRKSDAADDQQLMRTA